MAENRLSPAEHVANREAKKHLGKGTKFGENFYEINKIAIEVSRRFADRRKLSRVDFESIIVDIRSHIDAINPIYREEERKDPGKYTRNSSKWETILLARSADGVHPGSIQCFYGVHIYLTQKKFSISFDNVGFDFSRHLLERAIQRDLVGWDGNYAELEKAGVEAFGLMCVWRRVKQRRLLKSNAVLLPFGKGILLGRTLPSEDVYFNGLEIGKDASRRIHLEPNVFCSDGLGKCLRFALATTVNEEMTNIGQDKLRDQLVAFSTKHADSLSLIRRCGIWRKTNLISYPDVVDVVKKLDELAQELAEILGHEDSLATLNNRNSVAISAKLSDDENVFEGIDDKEVSNEDSDDR